MPFSPVLEILGELRAGRMVILTDDEDRENEGDLILPAQFVTPEALTFMLSVARGYLCLSLTEADCDRLDLHPQTSSNTTARGTAFTVSIDGHPRYGFSTGVSAHERARCIRMVIDPASRADDFVRPGHINPLRSRDGGVLVRTGQTEGSVDLCRLAGLYPAAAIIEVMRDDGEMARLPDLRVLADRHGLKICSVAQIIQWRLARESLIRRIEPVQGAPVRTDLGEFTLFAFQTIVDPLPHVALTVGGLGMIDPATGAGRETHDPILVRVHRRHLLGDVFLEQGSSPEGPTGHTLRASMRAIQAAGRGVVLYLRPEGGELPIASSPSGALERLLQTRTRDDSGVPAGNSGVVVDASINDHKSSTSNYMRDIGVGSQILRNLGLRRLRLLTNHTTEWPGLEAFGLQVVERVRIPAQREA